VCHVLVIFRRIECAIRCAAALGVCCCVQYGVLQL
jgi:hypothetical protein